MVGRPRKYPVQPTVASSEAVAPQRDGQVEIICIADNVHFGDGRSIVRQESAYVTHELAGMLVEKGMVKRV
ncbi:MAG TPA: hypothetical protein VFI87_06410 [Hyphomicrobiaceae bacterium]|nr:hypothetical protein [Hyphomicrobiaceae bacterium]